MVLNSFITILKITPGCISWFWLKECPEYKHFMFIPIGATAVRVQVTGELTARTARLYRAMRTSTGATKASWTAATCQPHPPWVPRYIPRATRSRPWAAPPLAAKIWPTTTFRTSSAPKTRRERPNLISTWALKLEVPLWEGIPLRASTSSRPKQAATHPSWKGRPARCSLGTSTVATTTWNPRTGPCLPRPPPKAPRPSSACPRVMGRWMTPSPWAILQRHDSTWTIPWWDRAQAPATSRPAV